MDRPNWESPGLDMGHGFVEQIRRRQHRNLQDNQTTKNVTVRMSPRCRSTKPTMNFYVPPAARKSEATAQPHKTEVEQSSSYPSHVVMTNPLLDKFKIEKFPAYLQPYIIQALINPAKLGANDMLPIMGYVCKYSIDECHYTLTGSKLCAAIIQKELEVTSSNSAYRCLVTLCRNYYRDKCAMRLESLSKWISFVSFVCQLFTELQNYSDLQDIVYNCLFTLVGPECLQNDSEVDCLVTQLLSIGKQLEECNRDVMDELYDNIRDAYLAWNSPASSRLPLLQAIELRAMKWQLDDDAKEYYYGEYTMSAI